MTDYTPVQHQPYGVQQRTNPLAVVALITSFFIGVVGIICGHIALSQIKETGEKGRGLAIAGLVIGYLSLLSGIVLVLVSRWLFSQ